MTFQLAPNAGDKNMLTSAMFDDVKYAFEDALKSTLKPERVLDMTIVPIPAQAPKIELYMYDGSSKVITLHEYADYFSVTPATAIDRARSLGIGAGVLYNALAQEAKTCGHKFITGLDGLHFNFVIDNGGMELDRKNEGWVAFRFHFGSGIAVETEKHKDARASS